MYEIFAFTRINTVVNESIFAKLFFPIFELNNFTKLFDNRYYFVPDDDFSRDATENRFFPFFYKYSIYSKFELLMGILMGIGSTVSKKSLKTPLT